MGTITEAVEHYLKEDIVLLDGLARDVASLRRTARWLIREHNIDGSEEAVVSAIRRYIQDHNTPPLARDRELLEKASVHVHTGLVLFILPRSTETQQRIAKAWTTIDPRDPIATWPSRKTFCLLAEQDDQEDLHTLFPPAYRHDIKAPTSAIKIHLPDDPKAISILGHATSILVHHDIPIHEVYTRLPETNILVPHKHTAPAYDAIAHLTREPHTQP